MPPQCVLGAPKWAVCPKQNEQGIDLSGRREMMGRALVEGGSYPCKDHDICPGVGLQGHTVDVFSLRTLS